MSSNTSRSIYLSLWMLVCAPSAAAQSPAAATTQEPTVAQPSAAWWQEDLSALLQKVLPQGKLAQLFLRHAFIRKRTHQDASTKKQPIPFYRGFHLDVKSIDSWFLHYVDPWVRRHALVYHAAYEGGLRHSAKYTVSHLWSTDMTASLYGYYSHHGLRGSIDLCRSFADKYTYAGGGSLRGYKEWYKHEVPGQGNFHEPYYTLYMQQLWGGRAWGTCMAQGRFFLIGSATGYYYTHRPQVTTTTGRDFHHQLLVVGNTGFARCQYYGDRWVYGMGSREYMPQGGKVSLIGGYALGEFVNRPYMHLVLAQGRKLAALGHMHGTVRLSTFLHKKQPEQSIVHASLHYFTPLLTASHQCLRQFITLDYLGGFHMLASDRISTNSGKVPVHLQDPFSDGTQRLLLHLETAVYPTVQVAGCRLVGLGFMQFVGLKTAEGAMPQSSFCKALGVGLRIAHPRLVMGAWEVRVSYHPITHNMNLVVRRPTRSFSNTLLIGAPQEIPFKAY